jgi:hypothetical protein
MRRMLLVTTLAVGALVLQPLVTAGPAWASGDRVHGDGGYRCVDASRVYYGNTRLIRNPAAISADGVYRHISEYREILEQGLTDKDARYHFLMRRASERFSKAVKSAARDLGHDVIAEHGAVVPRDSDTEPPPDVTQEVVSRIA